MVRKEAYYSLRGCVFLALSPTLALYTTKHELGGNAYCGIKHGWGYEVGQAIASFVLVDFFE